MTKANNLCHSSAALHNSQAALPDLAWLGLAFLTWLERLGSWCGCGPRTWLSSPWAKRAADADDDDDEDEDASDDAAGQCACQTHQLEQPNPTPSPATGCGIHSYMYMISTI